jgi:hypothetical protein
MSAVDSGAHERVESRYISPGKECSRQMGQTDRQRTFAALAIRGDGARVPVKLPQPVEVSLLGKLEVIVLELIGLITGSRWEPGDRRR